MVQMHETKYSCFEVDTDKHIVHLRLSRPQELNAMNTAFWRELPELLNEVAFDVKARVLVISSTGKHFSAGMDLSVFENNNALRTGSPHERECFRRLVNEFQAVFNCLEELRIPVIAAIQGGCIGAGLDMVSACDIRYALKSTFFCIQEINIGMMADLGTLQRLPKLLPEGVVRELAYTGERLSAERAKNLGFVNEIFDTQEEMMVSVLKTAEAISARSPLAVSASKEAINYGRDHSIADALTHAAIVQSSIFNVREFAETAKAKKENREPLFSDLQPAAKL